MMTLTFNNLNTEMNTRAPTLCPIRFKENLFWVYGPIYDSFMDNSK